MSERDYRDIIFKPVVTEKTMDLLADGKYTFYVDRRSNKTEIKNAIEKIFNVKVDSVHTMIIKGKPKRLGRYQGRTSDRKKAVVSLKRGHKIKLFDGV